MELIRPAGAEYTPLALPLRKGDAVLVNLGDQVRLCCERAAEARRRADEVGDPEAKADFLNMERRWLLLARSYQFGDSLGGPEYSCAKNDGQGNGAPVLGHEANLAAILANTPFLLTRCSSDLRYLFVSAACARMLGRRPEEIEGKPIIDIIGDEGFQTILPYVQQVLGGEPVEYESDIGYAGVGPRRVLVKYTPDRDRSGNVQGWIASILDLTDQKKADARIAADVQAMTTLRDLGGLYVRKDVATDECLQSTVGAAISLVGADKGNLQVFDESSNALVIAAHSGFAEPFLTFFKHVRDDASTCAAAMRTTEQVIVEDVLESDVFAGYPSQAILIDAGVRAVISTPLTSSTGAVVGMISTHYANPHRSTDRDLYLLQLLARQTADYLERKRAEEIQNTLNREVQHRSNNLLSVIQAMALRTFSGDYSLVQAREIFEARLQALARANRELVKSNWCGVNLREIARSELAPFGERTNAEGVDVLLDPKNAQNFQLALHELATNAAKYGALSAESGRVDVSWSIKRERDDTSLNFKWRESGGPTVIAPARRGFGTTVLRSAFPDIVLEYGTDGFRCEIDMVLGKYHSSAPSRNPASSACS
jgi:PAS domain S-box-containing protein